MDEKLATGVGIISSRNWKTKTKTFVRLLNSQRSRHELCVQVSGNTMQVSYQKVTNPIIQFLSLQLSCYYDFTTIKWFTSPFQHTHSSCLCLSRAIFFSRDQMKNVHLNGTRWFPLKEKNRQPDWWHLFLVKANINKTHVIYQSRVSTSFLPTFPKMFSQVS